MKILLCGCIHGEFDKVVLLQNYYQPDLCLLLGDLQTFVGDQSIRSSLLLPKYRKIGHFCDILSGQIQVPTIAIHGNHEDSAFLSAFPNGGFLTKNLFYIGYSADIRYIKNGKYVQLFGISGINSTHEDFPGFDETEMKTNEFSQRNLHWHCNASINAAKYVAERSKLYKSHAIFMSHDWPAQICKQIKKEELKTNNSNFIGSNCGGFCSRILFDSIQSFNSLYTCAHMHFYCSTKVSAKGHPVRRFLALNKLTYDKLDVKTGRPLGKYTGHQLIDIPGQNTTFEDGIWIYNKYIQQYIDISTYNNDYSPNTLKVNEKTGKYEFWNRNAIQMELFD